jgi:hypothetical protein
MLLEENKFTKEEIKSLIESTLRSPANMVMMLLKYGNHAVRMIDHGQLHLDFDNRDNTSWNDDIINMFPLDYPVTMTSWKGVIYVHCLEDETIDCSCMGTRKILEMILLTHGDKRKLTIK